MPTLAGPPGSCSGRCGGSGPDPRAGRRAGDRAGRRPGGARLFRRVGVRYAQSGGGVGGTEVVLLASVQGGDGYLRTNERVEWTIAPGGVGYFTGVGYNGASDYLFGIFRRGKIDNSYAIGATAAARNVWPAALPARGTK